MLEPVLLELGLSLDEIAEEVKALENEGHKRIMLVAGEEPQTSNIDFLEKAIARIYTTKQGCGEIRRLNVNVAPMPVDDFIALAQKAVEGKQLL